MRSHNSIGSIANVLLCFIAAHAAPCKKQIARVEMALSRMQADQQIAPTARESRAARLHHQPTPKTVAKAETVAKDKVETALGLARKLDSEGKDSECLATLEKALPLGVP
jgi:hypothetical protein